MYIPRFLFSVLFCISCCFKMTWHRQSYCVAQAGLSFSGSTHPPVLSPQGADITGMCPSTCHIRCFLHPFICSWSFRGVLHLGCCECRSSKHGSIVNLSIVRRQILVLKLIFRGGIPWWYGVFNVLEGSPHCLPPWQQQCVRLPIVLSLLSHTLSPHVSPETLVLK